MPKINCECQYCGKVFDEFLYNVAQIESIKCKDCGDSNVKVSNSHQAMDVFGYNSDAPKPDAYIRKK